MFLFMPWKLSSNFFAFCSLRNYQFAFASFGERYKSQKCYEIHADPNSVLKQKKLIYSLSSTNLISTLFLPLSPERTLALNLNFPHLVHVLRKLGDVCIWFTSHSAILTNWWPLLASPQIPIMHTSNCFEGYDTLDVIGRPSEKYLAMSHDKATWTKGLCPCDFTQWEIMNFFSPCRWPCARVHLEASFWHESGNLFSSDIWSFNTKIQMNTGKNLIIFHILKLYKPLRLVQEHYFLRG